MYLFLRPFFCFHIYLVLQPLHRPSQMLGIYYPSQPRIVFSWKKGIPRHSCFLYSLRKALVCHRVLYQKCLCLLEHYNYYKNITGLYCLFICSKRASNVGSFIQFTDSSIRVTAWCRKESFTSLPFQLVLVRSSSINETTSFPNHTTLRMFQGLYLHPNIIQWHCQGGALSSCIHSTLFIIKVLRSAVKQHEQDRRILYLLSGLWLFLRYNCESLEQNCYFWNIRFHLNMLSALLENLTRMMSYMSQAYLVCVEWD